LVVKKKKSLKKFTVHASNPFPLLCVLPPLAVRASLQHILPPLLCVLPLGACEVVDFWDLSICGIVLNENASASALRHFCFSFGAYKHLVTKLLPLEWFRSPGCRG
jgi:hypothetical protein